MFSYRLHAPGQTDEGVDVLQKNRIKEAAQRYQYALKKFPREGLGEEGRTFHDLKLNFLLNLSRCKRKQNVSHPEQQGLLLM